MRKYLTLVACVDHHTHDIGLLAVNAASEDEVVLIPDDLVWEIFVVYIGSGDFALEVVVVFVGLLVDDFEVLQVSEPGLVLDDGSELFTDFLFYSFLFLVDPIGRDSDPAIGRE